MNSKIQRLVCSLVLAIPLACVSTPDGSKLDLYELHKHIESTSLVLGDIALSVKDTEPELSARIEEVASKFKALDDSLEVLLVEGGAPVGTIQAIDDFLIASKPLLDVILDDPKKEARVEAAIIAVRAIAIQVRIALT